MSAGTLPRAIPCTGAPRWPEGISPGRFASTIRTDTPNDCRIGLLGLADDVGVRLNAGRPGAAGGPVAFRAALARYATAEPHGFRWPRVFDGGNIEPAEGDTESALQETHRRVGIATTAILDAGLFPVAVGGGHDLTYPFAKAVFEHSATGSARREVVYFDAHLDVREGAGSGMAFRRLVEDCGVSRLHLIGADPFANSAEHVAWFMAHGGGFVERPPQTEDGAARVVSFDLDCLDGAVAPGVSAINPAGLSMMQIEPMVRSLGASPSVRSFDIMELCPPHDDQSAVGGRTGRIAARLFLTFLRGFSERTQ